MEAQCATVVSHIEKRPLVAFGDSRLRSKTGLWFVTLILIAVTCAAFLRCWDYGLVNLDDYYYIFRHADVVTFAGWPSVVAYFTDVSEGIWMPLTWISYAIDHGLFGSWLGGFHLHSVLLHAVNAVLVWRLLVRLLSFDAERGARHEVACLIAALAWAVHPLRCESVVFLASRKDVLSFLWELCALNAWVRGSQAEETGRRVGWTALSVAFFVLGAMCKPSVMTFPLLCLLLDLFIVRRVRPLRYLLPFVLMVVLGAFAGWQQSVGGATANGAGETLVQRLAVAAAAFGTYLINTAWPFRLAVQCVKQWPAWPHFLLPGVVLSALWGGFLVRRGLDYWAKRRETVSVERIDDCPVLLTFGFPADFVLAGMAWFALAVAPMLGLASFGYHSQADRFTYIPSFGLALIAAFALARCVRRFGAVRTLAPAVVVLLALVALTGRQTGYWRDDLALFSHTVEVDGDGNAMAHRNLGMYHFEITHDLEKARFHFGKASAANMPVMMDHLDIYAITLAELGLDDEASRVIRTFEDEVVRTCGRDAAIAILNGAVGMEGERRTTVVFRAARIAAALGKVPSLETARQGLERLRYDGYSDYCVWPYLTWRYLTLSGDEAAAGKMLGRLLKPTNRANYLQFRFLQARSDG